MKRPSVFTMYIIIGVIIILIAVITILFIGHGGEKRTEELSGIDKVKSISGEENVEVDADGNKINSSSQILSRREVDGFIFDSFNVSTNSGISTITFEIYNPDSEDKELGEYEIKIVDSNGNMIGRLTDNAGVIEGLSRKEVSLQVKGDIANLTDLQIRKIVYENM